jgi:hypothetical protein
MTQDEARAAGLHGWQLAPCENGAHLIPVGDLHDHMDEGCSCGVVQNEHGLWVHNSFDGREAFENHERKPS